MGDGPGRATRHSTATASPMTKRVGYFGSLSSAGYAPAVLSPRQLAKENGPMITFVGPAAAKSPLKKKLPSAGKLHTETGSILESPKTGRSQRSADKRVSTKHIASSSPRGRQRASADNLRSADADTMHTEPQELHEEQMQLSEDNTHSINAEIPIKSVDELEETPAVSTPSRKRSRNSMTPSDKPKDRKSSKRTIAIKRSASISAMDTDDGFLELNDTPKSTGKTRSRDRVISPSKRAPPRVSHDHEKKFVKHAARDINDEDEEISPSRPPRKKQKTKENATQFVPSPVRSGSSISADRNLQKAVGMMNTESKKTSNLWNGFISRSIQKLKQFGSSPASPTSVQNQRDINAIDIHSEPSADLKVQDEQYGDGISSPGYRATFSAPHAVGSPMSIRTPQSQYAPTMGFQPVPTPLHEYPQAETAPRSPWGLPAHPPLRPDEFQRKQILNENPEQIASDFIDSRSASAAPLKSPFQRNTQWASTNTALTTDSHSPTAYLASPSAPSSSEWASKHTRSPFRSPTISRPSQIIPSGPRPIPHAHFSPPMPIQQMGYRQPIEIKPKKLTICEKVKVALRNLAFGLLVLFLVALIIWLFVGDSLGYFFVGDPAKINRDCAHMIKERLREQKGRYDCELESDEYLKIDFFIRSCRKDASLHEVKILLANNSELKYSREYWTYIGPSPRRPMLCAIRFALWSLVQNYAPLLIGLFVLLGLMSYIFYKWRRRVADQMEAKQMADKIISLLKEEFQKDGSNGYLIKDYVEDEFCKTAQQKRVWPQTVDLVEGNIRVRTLPRLVHGDQFVTWVWT